MSRRGGESFQTRECLASAFLDSRKKSSGKQLYGKRERKRRWEEKRGKAIGKRGEKEAKETSEKHFRVSGKNSLSRIEEFTRTCART